MAATPSEPVRDEPRLQDKAQAPFTLPELPKDADTFESQTLMITGSGPHGEPGVKQVVSRTPTRVHVEMPTMRQEWLFVRNPKDGRRVNAFLVVHSRKVILAYPESDLRMEGIARGWADVIALDPKQVKASSRGVDPRRLHDPQVRFADYRLFEISDWREELHEHGKPTDHHHGAGGQHGHGPHRHGEYGEHDHDSEAGAGGEGE